MCVIPFKSGQISRCALPLKSFENMACGKPVLSSELEAVKGMAHDVVRFCSNSEDYVEAIRALYEDEDLRRQMGRASDTLIET